MATPKHTQYTTPIGRFVYPKLVNADTKFDPDGLFTCKIAIPQAEAQELMDLIKDEVTKQAKAEPIKKGSGIKYADPPFEVDEEEGVVVFNTKQKARVTMKDGRTFTTEIKLFDAEKKDITGSGVNPWTGTRGRLRIELVPYSVALTGVGVVLRLRAAQIIELVSAGGGDAASYGFDAEEGYSDRGAPPSSDEGDEGDLPF